MVLDVAPEQAVEAVDPADVLEFVERDQRAIAAGRLEPERQLEERVERRQRVGRGLELEAGADPEGAERQADTRPLEESLDPGAQLALELLRVRPLEPDGHVGDRGDPIEIDEDRDQSLVALAVVERLLEEAGLPVLARRVEADVVAADRVPEQPPHLVLAIDDVLRRDGARVDEGVDVDDQCASQTTVVSPV